MLKCVVNGCVKEQEIREYCKTCYHRLWKSGELPDPEEARGDFSLPPYTRKPRTISVRKRKAASAIRLSYLNHLRNYRLCHSLEQRMYWRSKIRTSLKQAEEMGLTEEDLHLMEEPVEEGVS